MKVLHSSSHDWLGSWIANSAALDISHVRILIFFHPCPCDRAGLLVFAGETGGCDECVEIAKCVGKSMSKHRRKKKTHRGHSVGSSCTAALEIDEQERKDHSTPSTEIFPDHYQNVVERYAQESLVEQAHVTSIDYGFPDELDLHDIGDPMTTLFKKVTTSGTTKFPSILVLAPGGVGSPVVPGQLSAAEKEGVHHSTQLRQQS